MEKKRKKMKRSTARHWVQALFFALTNGYVSGFARGKIYTGENKGLCVPGLNCYSCPGALYACPIGSLQAVLNSRDFKVSCYVFGFIMLVGALFGRLICGFLCPFGLVQDLLHKIPFPKKMKNLPGHKYLKYLRYVFLIVFVLLLSGLIVNDAGAGKPWFCEYVCPSGTLLAGIPLVILNPALQAAIGWRFWLKIAILAVILLLSVLTFRPFCKYMCPLGALYGVCNPISFYRFRVDPNKCVQCGACQKACGMDIPVWQKPNSTECIRCGECKAACPTHAITSTWEDWKNRLVRPLPSQQPSAEAQEPAAPAAKSSLIAPEEKKNGFRTFIGVIFLLCGIALSLILAWNAFSIVIMTLMGQDLDSSNIFQLLCLYGSEFTCLIGTIVMWRAGWVMTRNLGRYTATLRAVRILVPAILMFVLTRILCIFYQNALTALMACIFWWLLPLLCLLLLLTCQIGKKKAENAAQPESETANDGNNNEQ